MARCAAGLACVAALAWLVVRRSRGDAGYAGLPTGAVHAAHAAQHGQQHGAAAGQVLPSIIPGVRERFDLTEVVEQTGEISRDSVARVVAISSQRQSTTSTADIGCPACCGGGATALLPTSARPNPLPSVLQAARSAPGAVCALPSILMLPCTWAVRCATAAAPRTGPLCMQLTATVSMQPSATAQHSTARPQRSTQQVHMQSPTITVPIQDKTQDRQYTLACLRDSLTCPQYTCCKRYQTCIATHAMSICSAKHCWPHVTKPTCLQVSCEAVSRGASQMGYKPTYSNV